MFHWQKVEKLRAKVDRAEEHLRNLRVEWDKFASGAYIVECKDDVGEGKRYWYLANTFPIPYEISLIAGDAVHNLRCALDHLAYYLVSSYTKGAGPFNNLYFPIGDSHEDFAKKLKQAAESKSKSLGDVVQRLEQRAMKAIEDIEPIPGRKGPPSLGSQPP